MSRRRGKRSGIRAGTHNAQFIRTLRAHASETVEVQWTLLDGRVYVARYTLPPQATLEARVAAIEDAVVGSESRGPTDRQP